MHMLFSLAGSKTLVFYVVGDNESGGFREKNL